MNIAIIDYGMGNLASVQGSLKHVGASSFVAETPAELEKASHIILPGVGSFRQAMENLHKGGWVEAIRYQALEVKLPFLGICLGMQLLASHSTEHGDTEGLGLIPGKVLHFSDVEGFDGSLRVPHVGWNEVKLQKSDDALMQGIEEGTDFYFVHSYAFAEVDNKHIIACTPYGVDFPSIVGNGNVWGTQFHPEKSSHEGFRVLKNFIEEV